jgi:hypothetical protein
MNHKEGMTMRHFLFLSGVLLSITLIFHSETMAQQRTEEYAIISAWQSGKKTRISVQIGSETTPDKEFEPEKGEKRFDMSPVVREMEALNAMGFELVTGNSAIIPQMTQGSGSGLPYYTFLFKRRIQ